MYLMQVSPKHPHKATQQRQRSGSSSYTRSMEEEVGRRVGPSSNSGDSPGPSNQASEVWKLLGRDTPGGKALFNIYGGNATGRNAGQQYHERNKTVHDKKMASGWAPKPLGKAHARQRRHHALTHMHQHMNLKQSY